MLVVDGAALECEAHFARLGTSMQELYGTRLPASAQALVAEHARGLALGRLRLTATPQRGAEPRVEVRAVPIDPAIVLPGWDRALDLQPIDLDGWCGGHKWADRRLLERLDAQAAPATAVLVDNRRDVLETTRANVFAVAADGVLRTPPTDGRILPGIARARVIAFARAAGFEVREERLRPDDLRGAREVFVTGSVRGVEPVRSFDGVAFAAGPGAGTAALADALRGRWFGDRALGALA